MSASPRRLPPAGPWLTAALVAVLSVSVARAGAPVPAPAPAAAPPADVAKPAAGKKRLLLVTHSGGFIHGSVKQAEITMKEVAAREGWDITCWRFTNDPDKKVTVKTKSKDGKEESKETTALEAYAARYPGGCTKEHCGRINAESLKNFDAVFFFTTGDPVQTREEQAALLDFVLSGKGFLGTHCATDTLYRFKEYGDMIGGYFNGHPWHTKIRVVVEEPDHPLMKSWGGNFEITDEIYQFRDPYSRGKLRILAKMDPKWLAEDRDRKADGLEKAGKKEEADKLRAKPSQGARKDDDYALCWVREFGKGKVFYTAFGHRDEVWKDAKFQAMIVAAVKWTTGEIEAPAAPSDKSAAGAAAAPAGK